eukprot:jgi/Tetstr1/462791/TSEL_007742.t1
MDAASQRPAAVEEAKAIEAAQVKEETQVKEEARVEEEAQAEEEEAVKEETQVEGGARVEEEAVDAEARVEEAAKTNDEAHLKEETPGQGEAPAKDEELAVNASTTGAATEVAGEQGGAFKKRKVALYLAYVGHGYSGMQNNPGAKTIESELMAAMTKAGAISEQNADSYEKIQWKRAARTDKGVSAIGNVVSLRMILHPPCMAARINENLPKQIRVLGFTRTTGGFDARLACDRRRYEYIMPEWAFDPEVCRGRQHYFNKTMQAQAEALEAKQEAAKAPHAAADAEAPAGAHPDTDAPSDAAGAGSQAEAAGGAVEPVPAGKSGFRMSAEQLKRLNHLLGKYIGTHNFHNYTVQVSPGQAAAKRHIISFRAEQFEAHGEPYVRMVVLGQSFMLHQIRKMVGMVIAIMREIAPEECQDIALSPNKDCNTPMAPALGLFLTECMYKSYNERWAGQEGREPLGADVYTEAISDFKQRWVYAHIVAQDKEESVNEKWLQSLNDANYKFTTWKDKPNESKKTRPREDGQEHRGAGGRGSRGGYKGKRPRWK